MAFTEFCCRSGGSNLNAGTRTGNSTEPGTSASFTYASGTWVNSTGVFTVASGNPSSDGVAVGDFASVYVDGSATTGFVGRVTARDTISITVSGTAKAGTKPADGVSNRTLKIGGAWKGPNGTEAFTFGFVQSTLNNAAGDYPRINFKNDATYSITAAMTHASLGPTRFQGYTTAYDDFGRATIDGGTSGASYSLLTLSANHLDVADIIFQNNGATGSATGCAFNSDRGTFLRCVFNSFRGTSCSNNNSTGACWIECEFYASNQSNTSLLAGLALSIQGTICIRCIFHDNAGSNTCGVRLIGLGTFTFVNCIFDTNGLHGIVATSFAQIITTGCDFYNNGTDGIQSNSSNNCSLLIESCNFIKNGAYGVRGVSGAIINGALLNNGYGTGTAANTSGNTSNIGGAGETGAINYASNVLPWTDAPNGDFRINLAAAKDAGRGSFTETAASYSGTVGYPDIGAAEAINSGGSGVVTRATATIV